LNSKFLEPEQDALFARLIEKNMEIGRPLPFAMLFFRGDGKVETIITQTGGHGGTLNSIGSDDTATVQALSDAGLISITERQKDRWLFVVTNMGRQYYRDHVSGRIDLDAGARLIRRPPSTNAPPSIQASLPRFQSEHSEQKTAFIIMSFSTSAAHSRITETIRKALRKHDIIGLRADDWQYHQELFPNIMTYMHGCQFGVAVFDRVERETQNPNVALEVGYMLALGKSICILKDKTLDKLPSDLIGLLYNTFDAYDPEKTIDAALTRWLTLGGLG
jgi:hypothetical protein